MCIPIHETGATSMERRLPSRMAMCLSALLLWSSSVAAADAGGRGFYIGAGIGSATAEATNPTYGGGDFNASDTSFRLLAGYSFAKHLALEASYLDGGKAEDFVGPYALSLEATALVVGVVGTWPVGQWDLSAKFGYAYYDADQTIRLGNLSESRSHSDSDFAGGLAAAFRFSPRLSVRAEYEAIRLDGGKFNNLSVNGIFKF